MNLYLFRNSITSKVLVSKVFNIQKLPSLLNQIGENHPCAKIRSDHWVPFSVVTNINPEIQPLLYDSLIDRIYTRPLKRVKLPLPKDPAVKHQEMLETHKARRENRGLGVRKPYLGDLWKGWVVPEAVKEKTILLQKGIEKVYSGMEEQPDLTIWWERDEYRRLIDSEGLSWPSFVTHKKLQLLRNRYALVPGLIPGNWTENLHE